MQRPIARFPGTADLTGDRLRERASLQATLLETIESWGYEPIEPPLLEEADLFLRKSGGELAARLYAVEDPGGGRVALRPEYTASVIRAHLAQGDAAPLPARWAYAGPVFRHQPLEQGEPRQITQVGAELVGATGALADAEVLAVACEGLGRAGLRGAVLTLGHLAVLGDFLLAFGLSDRAELFLLSRLSTLRDPEHGREALLEEARLLRLLSEGPADEALGHLLSGLDTQQARAIVHRVVASLGSAWVGSREMGEVESRLLEKLGAVDEPERLEGAVHFLAELTGTRGEGPEVLRAAGAVARRAGLDPRPLEPLAELIELLDSLPELRSVHPVLDLGLARGFAYYTGMVFEITHPALPGRTLGGGGRYDGLVKALGGPDLPALGFAYSLEAIAAARRLDGAPVLAAGAGALAALVVPLRGVDGAAALAEARRLRDEAEGPVALFPEPDAIEDARRYARGRGARMLVIVGPEGPRKEMLEA